MAHGIDPDSLGFLVGDIGRLMRGTFERQIEAAALPVTAAEARVLAHVARCDGVRQNRLAALLGVAPMSLTGFLDRLEGAGLVARETDPNDRRAKIVRLSAAADPVLERISAIARHVRACATAGMDTDEVNRFRDTALRMRRNLEVARDHVPTKEKTA